MVILPSDHIVRDKEFGRLLGVGVDAAHKHSSLITIGIQPTHPETGYGYIQIVEDERGKAGTLPQEVFKVKPLRKNRTFRPPKRFIRERRLFLEQRYVHLAGRRDLEGDQAFASGTSRSFDEH